MIAPRKAAMDKKEFFMKRFINVPLVRIFGIIAFAAVIGFSMASCIVDNGDTITFENTVGRLTITGIPSQYNGYYVYADSESGSDFLMAASSINRNGNIRFGRVSNGTVTLNIWRMEESEDSYSARNYNGTAGNVEFDFYFIHSVSSLSFFTSEVSPDELSDYSFSKDVSFTNGVASIPYSSINDDDDDNNDDDDDRITVESTVGRLTITNIPSQYNGHYVYAFGPLGNDVMFATSSISTNGTITFGHINNGTVTLNVWRNELLSEEDYSFAAHNFNGTYNNLEFTFFFHTFSSYNYFDGITNDGIPNEESEDGYVSFTNGIATFNFPDGDNDNNYDNDNNDDDIITVESTNGRLTINNIPSKYNGYYVYASGGNLLIAASGISGNGTMTFGQIANGTVTLNVWRIEGWEDSMAARNYTGTVHNEWFSFLFFDSLSSINEEVNLIELAEFYESGYVNFVNGIATFSFPDEDDGNNDNNDDDRITVESTNGRLTITDIPSQYNGYYVVAQGFYYDGDDNLMVLLAASGISENGTLTFGRIANGTVTLNVWRAELFDLYAYNYTATVNNQSFAFSFFDSLSSVNIFEESINFYEEGNVNFVNGVASIPYSSINDDDNNDNNGDDIITVESTVGRLTITGIPSQYNDYYVYADSSSGNNLLMAASSINRNGTLTFGQIVNGTVTLNVWIIEGLGDSYAARNYNGTAGNLEFDFYFIHSVSSLSFSSETSPYQLAENSWYKKDVNFTNGVASIPYSSINDDDNNDNNDDDMFTVESTVGRLTITGIPSQYDGHYVYAESYPGNNHMAASSINSNSLTFGQIVNGTVTLNVWIIEGLGDSYAARNYNGTASNVKFYFYFIHSVSSLSTSSGTNPYELSYDSGYENVNFTNGVASIPFSSINDRFTVEDTVGRLTITDIPSQYNGYYVYASGHLGNDFMLATSSTSTNGTITSGQIANGTVTLNVWRIEVLEEDYSLAAHNFNGTANNLEFTFHFYNSIPSNNLLYGMSLAESAADGCVSFTNGIATINNSSITWR